MRSSGFRADSVIQNTAERQAATGFTRGISTAQREESAGKGGGRVGGRKKVRRVEERDRYFRACANNITDGENSASDRP